MSNRYSTETNGERDYRKTREMMKKFVRYKEGAEMYSMSQSKFERMAKDANAVYKLNHMCLVNTEAFERYLETFHIIE